MARIVAILLMTPLYALWVLVRGRGEWVTHVGRRRIGAPPAIVFALLNPEHPSNRWVRRGLQLDPVDHEGRWRLSDPDGEAHLLTVLHEVPRMMIAFAVQPDPEKPDPALEGTADRYDLARRGDSTDVTLTCHMRLRISLSVVAYAFHELALRAGMGLDLDRLKNEAEDLAAGTAAPAGPA